MQQIEMIFENAETILVRRKENRSKYNRKFWINNLRGNATLEYQKIGHFQEFFIQNRNMIYKNE